MNRNVTVSMTEGQALAHQVDELAALYRLTDKLYRARSAGDVYEAALDAIRDTLGCSRASVLLFDDAGVMRFVAWRGLSETYRKAVDGHSPWKAGEHDPHPIFVPDIEDTAEPEPIKAAIRKEKIRALGFVPLSAQGEVIGTFMTYYEARQDFTEHEVNLAVTIARQVGFSLERQRMERARQSAVEELRESEERFRLMSEHAPVMIWMSHPNGSCLHLNRMLRTFWNVEEAAIASFDWTGTMHPDDRAEIGRSIGEAIANKSSVTIKGRYRNAEGRFRVLQTDARPRFSRNGEFLGMIGVNVDVTERELLLAELNHRVKNTLAVVQGIAHQTFKASDATAEARRAFEGRLVALGVAHSLLTQANWENASLEELAADTLLANGANRDRISLSGPKILLPPREALAMAMALHELFTNAMKYGALSNDAGRIELRWSAVDEPQESRLKLSWRESGGPTVSPPKQRGFGSLLLERTLAQDLNGKVTTAFDPEGVHFSIDAPMPSAVGAS
jgi:PAS domain S-box-containing protein